MHNTATYDPTVFDVTSMAEARAIILTPEGNLSTDDRWDVETPVLVDLAMRELDLTKDSVVLDYGCGVGRLAKELIDATGCVVVGADISANMRTFATRYVSSSRFLACDPSLLGDLNLRFDAALAVWSLQHCWHVSQDIERLAYSLRRSHPLLVVNERGRCVPSKEAQWVSDGVDVRDLLKNLFVEDKVDELPASVMPARGRTFWAVYTR